MEKNNKINNESDDHKKLNEHEHEHEQEENNIIKTNRENSNDNETNKILEKDENNNTENKSININDEKKKSGFFHDKDITEDSIIYFSNKLKQSNNNYKILLYISIVLHILNIIVFLFSKEIFNTFFNLFSILINLILVIYQTYAFRHNFEIISKEIYSLTQKIIYIYLSVVILFLINICYLFLFNFLFFKDNNNNNNNNNNHKDYNYSLIIMIYLLINIIVPIILLFRLIAVKKNIKNLSAAKGEIYESVKIEDVQVINSIINEN